MIMIMMIAEEKKKYLQDICKNYPICDGGKSCDLFVFFQQKYTFYDFCNKMCRMMMVVRMGVKPDQMVRNSVAELVKLLEGPCLIW